VNFCAASRTQPAPRPPQAIWLHVYAENAPAIRLYESSGYLLEGREEDYYAPGHAALIYGKPLESEPANWETSE